MGDAMLRIRQNAGALTAFALFVALLAAFIAIHPRFNTLALEAAANQVASELLTGSPFDIFIGIVAVLAAGAACGLVNGIIVVYGRIQPIIATLASGAVYTGIALLIRPIPGGDIDEGLSESMTYAAWDTIPTPVFIFVGLVAVVWLPFKNSVIGRGVYAVGSSEVAAFMSGVPIALAKLSAYTLAGLFAAMGGLFLGFQALSGDATVGVTYTLNSIAAVVIGGTSLYGGTGGIVGSIFGAYVLRIINSVLLFSGVPSLAQPLFQGAVLIFALLVSATRVVRIRNRLVVMD